MIFYKGSDNMDFSVIISGFGGQGVLMMGELLAYCAMKSGMNVTWMPAYGVEMRGGSANCTVVLSQKPIGAPLTGTPDAVIAMSEPAMNKFAARLQPEGLLMINSSLINNEQQPVKKIKTVKVPAGELAAAAGNEKMANLTMLGAFFAETNIIDYNEVTSQIASFLPAHKKELVVGFKKALHQGKHFVDSQL
jgi:2-oxoglutarate ferredoxin oxidoreductase subunit gamma